jgi:hypothetical protein
MFRILTVKLLNRNIQMVQSKQETNFHFTRLDNCASRKVPVHFRIWYIYNYIKGPRISYFLKRLNPVKDLYSNWK